MLTCSFNFLSYAAYCGAAANSGLVTVCQFHSIVCMNMRKAPTIDCVCFATCFIFASYNLLVLLTFLRAEGRQVTARCLRFPPKRPPERSNDAQGLEE